MEKKSRRKQANKKKKTNKNQKKGRKRGVLVNDRRGKVYA